MHTMKASIGLASCGTTPTCTQPALRFAACSRTAWPRQHPRKHSSRVCATAGASEPAGTDDGEELQLSGDWRVFKANMIKAQFSNPEEDHYDGGEACKANRDLLWHQNRFLAQEGAWARTTDDCAAGCLLVAGPQAGRLMDERYEQLVILLLQHGPDGSTGVILNRPCGAVVGDLLGWGWQSPVASSLEAAFSDSRIYLGGFFAPMRIARQPITCLHGQADLAGSREIAPGIYIGGEEAAAQQVVSGVNSTSVRFFSGLMTWQPGQLQIERTSGIWYVAEASRVIALKECLQLPLPLWREVLHLMGADYEKVALETP